MKCAIKAPRRVDQPSSWITVVSFGINVSGLYLVLLTSANKKPLFSSESLPEQALSLKNEVRPPHGHYRVQSLGGEQVWQTWWMATNRLQGSSTTMHSRCCSDCVNCTESCVSDFCSGLNSRVCAWVCVSEWLCTCWCVLSCVLTPSSPGGARL